MPEVARRKAAVSNTRGAGARHRVQTSIHSEGGIVMATRRSDLEPSMASQSKPGREAAPFPERPAAREWKPSRGEPSRDPSPFTRPEKPAEDADSRHERIARAAYLRAASRGFEPGREVEDWLESERAIDAESQRE